MFLMVMTKAALGREDFFSGSWFVRVHPSRWGRHGGVYSLSGLERAVNHKLHSRTLYLSVGPYIQKLPLPTNQHRQLETVQTQEPMGGGGGGHFTFKPKHSLRA